MAMREETYRRRKALANMLNLDVRDIVPEGEDISLYASADCAFMVMREDEAEDFAKECVVQQLYDIHPAAITRWAKKGVTEKDIKDVQKYDPKVANPVLEQLIEDMDALLDEQLFMQGGRGYFLASDGEENEEGEYFIYRLN